MTILSSLLNHDMAGLLITLAGQSILISIIGIAVLRLFSEKSAPVRSLACSATIAILALVFVITVGIRLYDTAMTQSAPADISGVDIIDNKELSDLEQKIPDAPLPFTELARSAGLKETASTASSPMPPSYSISLDKEVILIIYIAGIIWLTGAMFQIFKLGYGVLLIKKFRNTLSNARDFAYNEMAHKVACTFRMGNLPDIYSSSLIKSPITIGIFNPIVVIPENLFENLNENELKSILIHELSHIYHYDQVVSVIKRVVIALHWWNPFIYSISRCHEQAREEVSDNYVLTEISPRAYIKCLMDLAEKVCLISSFPTAIGMAGRHFNLRIRVEQILSKKRSVAMRTKIYLKVVTFILCLVLTYVIASFQTRVKAIESSDSPEKPRVTMSADQPGNIKSVQNPGRMIQEELSNKKVQESFSPVKMASLDKKVIVKDENRAFTGIQTSKDMEKKDENLNLAGENVSSPDNENMTAPAEIEPPMKATSDSGNSDAVVKTEDANKYISSGFSYLKKGQTEEAVISFDRAIEIDPGKALTYVARGSAYFRLGRFDKALSDFSKAIEIDPGLAAAYQNRGSVYYRQGQFDKAISDYNRAIGIEPGFAVAYIDRGNIYISQDRFDDAISDFSRAIEINPGIAAAYEKRGNAYYHQGKFSSAFSDYSKALKLNPGDFVVYTSLGMTYFSQKHYEKAVKEFDKAIKLYPGYANAYISRGTTYNYIGNKSRAAADYKKALELDPGNTVSQEMIQYCEWVKRMEALNNSNKSTINNLNYINSGKNGADAVAAATMMDSAARGQ